jgi:N-formylglutamate deformylase
MIPPLYELSPGATPLLISMPHSGTYLPPELATRMTGAAREVPDTDWFIPQLYQFAGELGATVICATHSRYVVDLNRPPDGEPLYPGRRETGVCPIETFDGDDLYGAGDEPSPEEIAARLQRYWQPYHDQLLALLHGHVANFGRCLLWDAHSIHSTLPGLFDGRLPDLNVGTADGRSCSPGIATQVVGMLAAQTEFTHVLNGRFKGGYITRHYGQPAAHIDAVQLEIAQSAYLREARAPIFDAAFAGPLQILLRQALSELSREA